MRQTNFAGKILGVVGPPGNEHVMVNVPHVCIIESPSAEDVLDKRKEGLALSEALTLASILNEHYAVSDEDTFRIAFDRIAQFAAPSSLVPPDGIPMQVVGIPQLFLHLSCHGDEDGIYLTNGDFIEWEMLGELMIELGKKVKLFFSDHVSVCPIILCMSSCCGLHALKMATDPDACPFIFLVGAEKPVSWTDSLTAFITFYHHLVHKHRTAERAVKSMNDAAMRRGAFRVVNAGELGARDTGSSLKVVLMSASAEGKFRWVYDTEKGFEDRPEVYLKDQPIDDATGKTFPYFDDPDEAMDFMDKNREQVIQVENGAAIDIRLINEAK